MHAAERLAWRQQHRPGVLAVLLVLAGCFVALGFWQLDRAELLGQPPPRPQHQLVDVAQPAEALSEDALAADVTVTGTYSEQQQLRVIGGVGSGELQATDWVLTPLEVATNDGVAVLPVVRGSVAAGQPLPTVPPGPVEITGRLLFTEPPPEPGTAMVDGQTTTVSVAELLNRWGGRLYSGYLLAAAENPTTSQLVPVPPPTGGTEWALQNVLYAIQWWVFAVFCPLLWWRLVRAPDTAPDTVTS